MLFAFSNHPFLLQPFTTNHQAVINRMQLFHAYGQTALYDSTYAALEMLAHADYPNRTIILITDGMDNASATVQKGVAARAGKDGVPIYAIGIGDPEAKAGLPIGPLFVSSGDESERVDAESLKAFSAAAGGQTFIVPSTAEDAGNSFMTALSVIADTIARGYAIGIVIPENGNLSRVKVTVANRPDLLVQTRMIATNP
jgi:hypothetical protein